MKFKFASAAAILCLSLAQTAHARLLQIIHTNDLHSHFEHSDITDRGGYAAVKARIDELRQLAAAQGIETLVVDAGDFSEGTQFYLVDEGQESWRILDEMGYDAVALGNHDWMVGVDQLNRIAGAAQNRVPILSANFKFDPNRFEQLGRHVLPATELDRSGVRIAIMGLSTDEFVYRWRAQNGFLTDPLSEAKKLVPKLRARNDFVIALTHLGDDVDVDLATKVPGIDLVVGGHSHTFLFEPRWARAKDGRAVPVVQTGEHGQYVGDLLVDVEAGKPLKVVHYRLVPVSSDGPKDPQVAERVALAREKLESRMGKDWLYQPIVESEIPIERPITHPTHWGDIYADSIQDTARADLSLDVGEFFGGTIGPGTVTREKLFQFYPRIFDVNKPKGWNVWSIFAPGWLIQIIVKESIKAGRYMNLSGITFEASQDARGEFHFNDFRIGGKPLLWWQIYRVGVTEGIGRGAQDISFLLRLFFWPEDTGTPIISAVERKLRALGPVIRAREPASLSSAP